MNDNNNKTSGGISLSFGTILFIVFLILKLTNVINWSWWWVTAPLWIPLLIALVGILILLIWYAIASLIASLTD